LKYPQCENCRERVNCLIGPCVIMANLVDMVGNDYIEMRMDNARESCDEPDYVETVRALEGDVNALIIVCEQLEIDHEKIGSVNWLNGIAWLWSLWEDKEADACRLVDGDCRPI
jgi:hypothetical protein